MIQQRARSVCGTAEIPGEIINGALVVQNRNMAQTMAVIDLTLEKDGEAWKVAEKTSETIRIADFDPDAAMVQLLSKYHEEALADAEEIIGICWNPSLHQKVVEMFASGVLDIPASAGGRTLNIKAITEEDIR